MVEPGRAKKLLRKTYSSTETDTCSNDPSKIIEMGYLSLCLSLSLSLYVQAVQDLYVIELQKGIQFELTNITHATHRVESDFSKNSKFKIAKLNNAKNATPADFSTMKARSGPNFTIGLNVLMESYKNEADAWIFC